MKMPFPSLDPATSTRPRAPRLLRGLRRPLAAALFLIAAACSRREDASPSTLSSQRSCEVFTARAQACEKNVPGVRSQVSRQREAFQSLVTAAGTSTAALEPLQAACRRALDDLPDACAP